MHSNGIVYYEWPKVEEDVSGNINMKIWIINKFNNTTENNKIDFFQFNQDYKNNKFDKYNMQYKKY